MKLLVILLIFFIIYITEEASVMSAPECPSFCPAFCKGKCSGSEAKATCDGYKCHCSCSATAVDCKADECEAYCKSHSGGRYFEFSCSKPHVCKCSFGDSTAHMNRVDYPIPKDAHYEVVIKPE